MFLKTSWRSLRQEWEVRNTRQAQGHKPSSQDVEAGGSGFQSYPQVDSYFKASLGCTIPCLKGHKNKGLKEMEI